MVNSWIFWVEVVEVVEVEKVVILDLDDDKIIVCVKLVNVDFIILGDIDLLNIKVEVIILIVSVGEFMDILVNFIDDLGSSDE